MLGFILNTTEEDIMETSSSHAFAEYPTSSGMPKIGSSPCDS